MAKFIEFNKSYKHKRFRLREKSDNSHLNNTLYIYYDKFMDGEKVNKNDFYGKIEYVDNHYVFVLNCLNGWYVQMVSTSLNSLRDRIACDLDVERYYLTTSKKWQKNYRSCP